ncbi:MAG: SPASM domain-containing protein [Candidatus Edwardsbacteria bacterium]|nr:SPASM domain-containing protein [Candidatus Edwardsbacteria bacterium]
MWVKVRLTNGMLIDGPLLSRLARYPVPDVSVSLDGRTAATVERFKTGVAFERVVAAVGKIRSALPGTSLSTVFVAHTGNIRELPGYMDFVSRLGVRTVFVNHLLSFTPATAPLCLYANGHEELAGECFRAAARRAAANGQSLWLPGVKPELRGCRQAENLFIGTDGNICPCDFLAVSTPFHFQGESTRSAPVVFGNALEQDARAVFNSRPFSRFRAAHRSGEKLPQACRSCIDAYGLMCSNRKRHGA